MFVTYLLHSYLTAVLFGWLVVTLSTKDVLHSIHIMLIRLFAFETGIADTELSTYIPLTEFRDVTFEI